MDKTFFPQISAVNWPSHVLQVWLTLHALGVPEENLRFIPELGALTAPEVVEEDVLDDPDRDPEEDPDLIGLRHPHGSRFDQRTQRVTVSYVDPEQIRPRLRVNIRSETLMRSVYDAEGVETGLREEVVGRLAHFMEPLMAGLPIAGGQPGPPEERRPGERPLAWLARQVGARYPEMLRTVPPAIRDALDKVAEGLDQAIEATEAPAQERSLREGLRALAPPLNLEVCRTAYLDMAAKITPQDVEGLPDDVLRGARLRFRGWAEVLFLPDAEMRVREILRLRNVLESEEAPLQRNLLRQLRVALSYENEREREKVVRELIEIMTTEAFHAVAATDTLWGVGWIHGWMSDFRVDTSPLGRDGLFMSVTGGLDKGTVLLTLARRWAEQGGFLGVGAPQAPLEGEEAFGRECLDMQVFDAGEQAELWALVTLRRTTPDAIVLLETALRRLAHPEASVRMRRYAGAPGRYGTLLAQPGSTAVLGCKALLQYPGVVITLPLVEDENEESKRVKAKLPVLRRLFLPVCFRVEVVWQEAVARLDSPTYLQHDFQRGVHLADPWAAMTQTVEEEPDPVMF